MPGMGKLEEAFGYTFKDHALLTLALTHPSVVHEAGCSSQTNQRLEYLGDAVLQLTLSQALYALHPEFDEGFLTKARAKLVNRSSLASQARRVGLGSHLVVSRGEELHGGRDRPSALADTFEAVLGAVFLDGGYEAARAIIIRQFEDELADLEIAPGIENPKGELQEVLQAKSPEPPLYEITSVTGPDHDRHFHSVVSHEGRVLAAGEGKSKKEAQSNAALNALLRLNQSSKNPA